MFPRISFRHGFQAIIGLPMHGELVVGPTCISLFWAGRYLRSLAEWVEADALIPGKPWMDVTPEFSPTLRGLIAGVLDGCPPYGLLDYLLEYAPDNLRAELEPRMAAAG